MVEFDHKIFKSEVFMVEFDHSSTILPSLKLSPSLVVDIYGGGFFFDWVMRVFDGRGVTRVRAVALGDG